MRAFIFMLIASESSAIHILILDISVGTPVTGLTSGSYIECSRHKKKGMQR